MSNTAGRRWFQFSLRALIALMVLAGAIFWAWGEYRAVQNRHEVRRWLASRQGQAVTPHEFNSWLSPADPNRSTATIPFWREWLGDEPVAIVYHIGTATAQEIAMTKAAFPEAHWAKDPRPITMPIPPEGMPGSVADALLEREEEERAASDE